MQKFFQQKQSMQTAEERFHFGQPADAIDKEIDELSKHYNIHKRKEVTGFIKRHLN